MWIPEEDGITHINIYSKGKTELGRWLSNFAYSPFVHPTLGPFASVEGFWYWLKTGRLHDVLRDVHGWNAKKVGKTFPEVYCENFDNLIKTAIRAKLIANPRMLNALIDTNVILVHYYVYGGKVVSAGYEWIPEYIQDIRDACVEKGYRPK